tara:strand:+ start:2425 stop:2622 length:198 start_codon:yes stop_codon:yes gene_type:complete
MNYIVLFLIFVLFYAINTKISTKEDFDGIGKGFGQFFFPKSCCKSKSCYPGMYLGRDFWQKNNKC